MKKISVVGASGRMGRSIVRLLTQESDLAPGMGVEFPENTHIGKDMGEIAGVGAMGIPLSDSRETAFKSCDGIIDFSTPVGTMETLQWARTLHRPLVIGTTGFSPDQLQEITDAGKDIPVLLAPNMSLGVNLLFKLAAQATRAIKDQDFDIEVVEYHHRYKKDSPSGTAKRLAEIIAKERGSRNPEDFVYGREGNHYDTRPRHEIGIHAVRAGDIVGEHTIFLTALGERIELTHRAHSRDTFASGAIAAVRFLLSKQYGVYSMFDVLGL